MGTIVTKISERKVTLSRRENRHYNGFTFENVGKCTRLGKEANVGKIFLLRPGAT